jgi:uncharacterized membrane protein YtjA (UPF0391 family)
MFMISYIVTFFIMAVISGVMGFSGFAADFSEIAQFLSLLFIMLFLASLMLSTSIGGQKNAPPL